MDFDFDEDEDFVKPSWTHHINDPFNYGQHSIASVQAVKEKAAERGFNPTGNFRGDFERICELLQVIPHPAFIRPQLAFHDYYCSVETRRKRAEDLQAQGEKKEKEKEDKSEGAVLRVKPSDGGTLEVKGLRVDSVSVKLLCFLLPFDKRLSSLVFSNCYLDVEQLQMLSEAISGSETANAGGGAAAVRLLHVDWNLMRVTAYFYRSIHKELPRLEEDKLKLLKRHMTAEFLRAVSSANLSGGKTPRDIFYRMDINHDTKVTWEEYFRVVQRLKLTPFAVHLFFALWDVNGDQVLREEEFVTPMEEMLEDMQREREEREAQAREAAEKGEAEEKDGANLVEQLETAVDGGPKGRVEDDGLDVLHKIDPYVSAFAAFCAEASPLSVVSFRACELGTRHLRGIASELSSNITLKVLNLWGNKIDDRAAEHIGALLGRNRSLTHLNLGRNRLSLAGLLGIIENIGCQVISKEDVKVASGVVKEQQSKAKSLQDTLKKSKGIDFVWQCDRLEEKEDVSDAKRDVLYRNCTLCTLDVSRNPVENCAAIARMKSLGPPGGVLLLQGTPAATEWENGGEAREDESVEADRLALVEYAQLVAEKAKDKKTAGDIPEPPFVRLKEEGWTFRWN